ncbi:MAG: MotA/TolQ/ExbB proton channel family protein [Clostridiales bacterium]|nr:MotA/TolQ/ExbB proton channel family protein [Clostridiales bacterium]
MRRKDFSTALGLLSGVLVITLSLIWGQKDIGKTFMLFFDVPSIFIVIFGSFSSIIISFKWETVKNIPNVLKTAFMSKEESKIDIIRMFIDLSKQARREGLLSLENEIDKINDNYIKSGVQMIIDGFEEDSIQKTMELAMDKTEERHKKYVQVFRMWANLAPSYGMLGTFIGLILMMANFKDMSRFSSAFATVLVTSFYGAVLSNLVFAPLANKLDIKNSDELNKMELVLEGIMDIHSGVNPRIMEENLKTFLSAKEKKEYELSNGQRNQEEAVIRNAA